MYLTSFGYRHTTTDASASVTFAMRNPTSSGKLIMVQKVILTVGFDGTSAASRVGYGLTRFDSANPTSGTSPARTKRVSTAATSVIADAQIKNGAILTLSGANYDGNFHELLIPTTQGAVITQEIRFDDKGEEGFALFEGEGLAARLALIAVAGLGVSGSVWWLEKQKI